MPLPYGGFVVDTPGLKEFGVWKAESVEVRGAFPELVEREGECRYANCSHEHEPDCDVRAAVDRGEVDLGRYQSYLGLLAEIEERA
jgi:ribosome biogenesis GTPase